MPIVKHAKNAVQYIYCRTGIAVNAVVWEDRHWIAKLGSIISIGIKKMADLHSRHFLFERIRLLIQHCFNRCVLQVKRFGNPFVNHLPVYYIKPQAKFFTLAAGGFPALIGKLDCIGKGSIG